MNFLIIGDINHIYNSILINEIKGNDPNAHIIFLNTNSLCKSKDLRCDKIIHTIIPYFIYNNTYLYSLYYAFIALPIALNKIKKHHIDILNIQGALYCLGIYPHRLKSISKNIVLSFWGSDFYKANRIKSYFQKKIVKIACRCTFSSKEMASNVSKRYCIAPEKNVFINRYSKALEIIINLNNINKDSAKENYNIPLNFISVTCGYNANSEHKHLKFIQEIDKLPLEIQKQLFIIFPLSYGGSSYYKEKIKNNLVNKNYRYLIIDSFINDVNLSLLRIASDIMFMLPDDDQLANSLLEYIAAENIVVTGKWLPYGMLDENNIFRIILEKMEDISMILMKIIQDMNLIKFEIQKNNEAIKMMLRNNLNNSDWYSLFKSIE